MHCRRWALCWRGHGDENADLEKGQQSHDLKEEAEEKEKDHLQDASTKHVDGLKIEEYPFSPRVPGKAPLSTLNPVSELPIKTSSSESEPLFESSSESGGDD